MKRRLLLLLSLTALAAILLSGCSSSTPMLSTYSLEVDNYCAGSDTYVNVYIDGNKVGTVYTYGTFGGISYGSHDLAAHGTGTYGTSFSRTVFFDTDMVWTLCP